MFKDLAKTNVVCAAIIDIKDEQYFKAMYYVLHAVLRRAMLGQDILSVKTCY
jgi:hypothetical protein